MQQQLIRRLKSALRGVVTALARLLKGALHAARMVLGALLNLVAALIVLFEEWGWRPLSAALGWLARFRLVRRIETAIAGLPPYGALAVFALPAALLFPLKLVAVWLLAQGHVASATALFVAAKIASTALVARIFMLTRPALMRIAWFARAYNWFMPWKEAMFAVIRASWIWRYGRFLKGRIVRSVRALQARLKPRLEQGWRVLRRRAALIANYARARLAELSR